MINLAIIGCGNMGRTHANSLKQIPESNIQIFADIHLPAAVNLWKKMGEKGTATSEIETIFSNDGIDAVIICTHHHLNKPYCLKAAERGKHIFVEKPLGLNVQDCEIIESSIKKAGVKCMVGFQSRFSPFIKKLKTVIPYPKLTIGQMIDSRWKDSIWGNDPIKGGGNVLAQGCHIFDTVYWLNSSEPVSISADGGNVHHPKLSIVDLLVSTIRFENGAIANCIAGDVGLNAHLGKTSYQLFDGHKTATLFNYDQDPSCIFHGVKERSFTIEDLPDSEKDLENYLGYFPEIAAFVDWVQNDTFYPEAATLKDGTRATRMIEKSITAITESEF